MKLPKCREQGMGLKDGANESINQLGVKKNRGIKREKQNR